MQGRIFEPFEQVDMSFARQHEGAGLGLAIAQRIVERLGGSIRCDSEPGRGTRFDISLPAGIAPAEPHPAKVLAERHFGLMMRSGFEADTLAAIMADHGATVMHFDDPASARKATGTGEDRTMLLDSRVVGSTDEALGLAAELGLAGWRSAILIEPHQRGALGAAFKAEGHAFLTRPVREASLLRVLGRQLRTEDPTQRDRRGAARARRHILLAEDNPVNALLAREVLGKAGHHVTWAENGQIAVDKATAPGAVFDLILMDVHMPVMDGVAAIRMIRNHEEEKADGQRVAIIALTADDHPETEKSLLAVGAQAVVEKPLCLDYLDVFAPRSDAA